MDPLDWIISDDTGISSRAIWSRMMGRRAERNGFGNHPHDPADFGRCYRLLKAIPAWRPRIGEMATESSAWFHLVEHWDAIEACFEAEASAQGADPMDRHAHWMAWRTYNLMQRVIGGRYDPTQAELAVEAR